jgi:Flp pilus assembly pilin Flp
MQKHPPTRCRAAIRGLWKREEGQAAVEYGVLAAVIIAVCVAIIQTLGTDVSGLFQSAVTAF